MVELKNRRSTKQKTSPERTTSTTGYSFSENILPYAVLGFSVLTLGLSVYGIQSGSVEQYVLNHQSDGVVYASPNDESPTSTESTDINLISEGGDTAVDGANLTEEELELIAEHRESEQAEHDAKVIAEYEAELEAEEKAKTEKVAEEKVQAEEKAEAEKTAIAEKASSMRLRIQPDRDLGDTYYYVVEKGDTLASLSQHFNLPMGQLMEENHIEQANHIYVGEVIFMPGDYTPAG